jgi:polyhydroxybutyrate depolymerase
MWSMRFARAAGVVAVAALVALGGGGGAAVAGEVGSAGCGSGRSVADVPVPPGREGQVVHTPEGWDGRTPLPVLLVFHGKNSFAAEIEEFSDLDTAEAIVVYPQGRKVADAPSADVSGESGRAWSPNDDHPDDGPDLAYVRQLVDDVEDTLCADPGRVHATGKSQGGGFTQTLACEDPDLVAAIAPVAAAVYRPGEHHGLDPADCRSGPRPVLEIHGVADGTITYDGLTADDAEPGRARPIRTVGGDEGVVDQWARIGGCGAESVDTTSHRGAEVHTWAGCAVQHYAILEGEHDWPGSTNAPEGTPCASDVLASRVVLDFLEIPGAPRSTC